MPQSGCLRSGHVAFADIRHDYELSGTGGHGVDARVLWVRSGSYKARHDKSSASLDDCEQTINSGILPRGVQGWFDAPVFARFVSNAVRIGANDVLTRIDVPVDCRSCSPTRKRGGLGKARSVCRATR
ncbi:MAG: hypothetical protein GDA36_02080 [Rhodobacteraceae bacterium]|nr:hypothetical protein [Paracoccaceae bacterium]